MKLSEFKGEEALDVVADLIEPIAEIFSDKNITNAVKSGKPKALLIKTMLKEHKKEVIQIMAILDRQKPENYEVNVFTLPTKLLEIINDEGVQQLFQSQGWTGGAKSSGSV